MKFLSSLGSRIVALFAFARFFGWRWLVVLPGLAAVVLSASVAYRDHVQLAEMRSALSAAHVVQVSDSSGHKLGAVLLPQQAGDFWVNQTASTPFTIKDGSGVARDSFSTTHGLFQAGGGGSDVSISMGPTSGSETSSGTIQSSGTASALQLGTNKSGATLTLNADAAIAALSESIHSATAMRSTFFDASGTAQLTQDIYGGSTKVARTTIPSGWEYEHWVGTSGDAELNFATTFFEVGGAAWWLGASGSGVAFGAATPSTTAPLRVDYSTSTTPLLQSGTSATSLTVGTNKTGATLALQYDAAVTGLTLGGNGLAPGVGTQSVTGGGTITPTATVLANPYITLTGTLSSGTTTIALPNAVGMWWFDISGLTFGGNTLRFNSGSANSTGITTLVTTTEIVQVFTGGSNTIAINL